MSELKGTTIRTKTIEIEKDYPWTVNFQVNPAWDRNTNVYVYLQDQKNPVTISVGSQESGGVVITKSLKIPTYSVIVFDYNLYGSSLNNGTELENNGSIKMLASLGPAVNTNNNFRLVVQLLKNNVTFILK